MRQCISSIFQISNPKLGELVFFLDGMLEISHWYALFDFIKSMLWFAKFGGKWKLIQMYLRQNLEKLKIKMIGKE